MSATLQIQTLEGYLHYDGGATPQGIFTMSSPGYVSLLDGNNLGEFSLEWTNTTGVAVTALTFTLFLDTDIDRDDNTFFNEHGEFISLLLPVSAPPGAIAASSWEIDEPEYVFGDIYTNVYSGSLDNSNGVPSSQPDDVSHALQIQVASLANGQTITVHGTLSLTDAAGLYHFDADSDFGYYFNAYATLGEAPPPPPPPPTDVPEPSTAILFLTSSMFLFYARRK